MDTEGTLEKLSEAAGLAFASLVDDLSPDRLASLLVELGLEELTDLSGDAQFQQKVSASITALTSLLAQLQSLESAAAQGDIAGTVSSAAALLQSLSSALTSLDAVATDLVRAAQSTSAASSAASISSELVDRLIEYAVVCQIERMHPVVLGVLELLTIVERDAVTLGSGTSALTVLRRRCYLDRLSTLLSDPMSLLTTGYGWGTETLQLDLLLERLGRFLLALDVITGDVLDDADNPTLGLDLFALTIGATSDQHPPGVLASLVSGPQPSSMIPLYQDALGWQVDLELTGAFQPGLGLMLLPPAQIELAAPLNPSPSGAKLHLQGQAQDPASPIVILSVADGTGLQATQVDLSLEWSLPTGQNSTSGSLSFEATVSGGTLTLGSANGDGFLAQVLPGSFSADFDFSVAWSPEGGFSFSGAAGLQASIPVHFSIGGITIISVYVGLDAASTGIQLELSAVLDVSIGPVQAQIDRMGLLATFDTAQTRGNLAIADLGIGFKPPSGVGLSIDSAGVSGGGFLTFDTTAQQYSGVLQLEFNDLALQAFGLITTQVAGHAGYSLLALIDADFPPVQLGWGFTLNGVGGLLGVNRCASTDALHAALKANTLSSILFPTNAISNASQVLATIDALFPTAPGRFVFGPMALIGWGTPTVLTAALAVVIELPEPIRIVLIARLALRLPSASSALIKVNMDALGILDYSQNSLSLDAALFDSKLVDFTLSGNMALRANWASSQREFLLALGGYHPQFTPPAGFPVLQRITIDMPSGAISKLRLAAYLAVSSNTVQFGATLDLFVGVSGYGLSGHLGFDALLQLDPFHFDADISGRVALTAAGDDLMSVGLDATLSGPAPWHIAGKFTIHLLFFDLDKSFSASWGQDAPTAPILPVDVLLLLTTALADNQNWGGTLPTDVSPLVSLKDPGVPIVHPLIQLEVHESVVPLGLTITRYGAAPLAGASSFSIGGYQVNGANVAYEPVTDDFAPAQFFDLSDTDKLARPSFEPHDAGVRLTGDALVTCGAPVSKTIGYETFYVDTPNGELRSDPPATPPKPFGLANLSMVLFTGAAASVPIRTEGNRRFSTPGNPVKVAPLSFVIADRSSLSPVGISPASGTTFSDAVAALNGIIAQAPSKAVALQIASIHEVVTN